ncbi:hypothetical protein [Alkalihalobacterium elongatum]|uniref:hypothetical protein n=1 Tax=Alkalihalobacterium elongatum TaxID=2675466 RepID=UPI001C1F73BD|nr:hypothetical protein [Alkalihalobacterium elongatum]
MKFSYTDPLNHYNHFHPKKQMNETMNLNSKPSKHHFTKKERHWVTVQKFTKNIQIHSPFFTRSLYIHFDGTKRLGGF